MKAKAMISQIFQLLGRILLGMGWVLVAAIFLLTAAAMLTWLHHLLGAGFWLLMAGAAMLILYWSINKIRKELRTGPGAGYELGAALAFFVIFLAATGICLWLDSSLDILIAMLIALFVACLLGGPIMFILMARAAAAITRAERKASRKI